jgi:hypothetical protein
VVEDLGITVLARTLVTPPLRIVEPSSLLLPLPPVDLAYLYGAEEMPLVVTELAHFLAESLTTAGPPRLARAA